jgi:Lrp/AsnC family transcriptional regulator
VLSEAALILPRCSGADEAWAHDFYVNSGILYLLCGKAHIFGDFMVDDTDRRLLRQLQAAPDAPVALLAERAGMTQSTYIRRLERLRQSGVVQAIREEVDWRAMGYAVEVSLRITLDKTEPRAFDEFIQAAREVPEVINIGTFLGRVDARLLVIARTMADYQRIYRDKILTLPHMTDIEALMQVATIKDSQSVPL